MTASDIAAWVGAVLSVLSLGTQALRTQFAHVVVSVERPPRLSGESQFFVLTNVGQAPARQVDLSFEHFAEDQARPVFTYEHHPPLPVSSIAPGATIRIPVGIVLGAGWNFDVEVSWRDRRPWVVRHMNSV